MRRLGISIARGGKYIRMRCGCREMRWFGISSYLCMGQCPRVPLFLTCVVQDHCLHSGYEDAAIRWDTVPVEYKSRYDRKMLTENRSKHIDWFCLTFGTSNSCLYKELCDDTTTCVTIWCPTCWHCRYIKSVCLKLKIMQNLLLIDLKCIYSIHATSP